MRLTPDFPSSSRLESGSKRREYRRRSGSDRRNESVSFRQASVSTSEPEDPRTVRPSVPVQGSSRRTLYPLPHPFFDFMNPYVVSRCHPYPGLSGPTSNYLAKGNNYDEPLQNFLPRLPLLSQENLFRYRVGPVSLMFTLTDE